MKPSSGKAKGRAAEREVAASFQTWWRQVEPGAVFFRTPRSGGWGHAGAVGLKTQGDVCYDPLTCKRWPFSVECKHQKIVTPGAIENFVHGRKSTIDKFWKQCCTAAEKDGVWPLLVFRGDKMPFRVAYRSLSTGGVMVRLLESFLMYDPLGFAVAFESRSAPTGGILAQ